MSSKVTSSAFPTPYIRAPVVEEALAHLSSLVKGSTVVGTPSAVRDFLSVSLADRAHEVFTIVFLDAQNRVIDVQEMFRGTLTQTAVYPREVALEALARHACSVVFAHNHPSGSAEPSRADIALTQTLKTALALIDVRVLDHFLITRSSLVSFAERGLL